MWAEMDAFTTEELVEELMARAEAYTMERTSLGQPGITFWFLASEWNNSEDPTAENLDEHDTWLRRQGQE